MSGPYRRIGGRHGSGGRDGPGAPTIVLHIDRLVLKGVSAADRDAVVEALRTSLAESFAGGFDAGGGTGGGTTGEKTGGTARDALGGVRASSHRASLRVPAFDVAAGAGPKALGGAAGAKLAGGLKR